MKTGPAVVSGSVTANTEEHRLFIPLSLFIYLEHLDNLSLVHKANGEKPSWNMNHISLMGTCCLWTRWVTPFQEQWTRVLAAYPAMLLTPCLTALDGRQRNLSRGPCVKFFIWHWDAQSIFNTTGQAVVKTPPTSGHTYGHQLITRIRRPTEYNLVWY